MSPNCWQDYSNECSEKLPKDLEGNILRQIQTFSMFGQVVELFVPDALTTAARLIGGEGDGPTPPDPRGPQSPEEPMLDWRIPPYQRKR